MTPRVMPIRTPRIAPTHQPTPLPHIAIDDALLDDQLLGASLGDDHDSWSAWLCVLRAAYGLPLSRRERKVFKQVAGDRAPPRSRVDELWCVVGRRGGKSRTAASIGVHAACFVPHNLVPGEIGEVAIIAASREQASVIFNYCLGFIQASPLLSQEIEGTTTNEIRLRGNIVIAVRTGSYRTVRGRTLLCAVVDEVAFLRDEASASPDIELYRALLPSLATTRGMFVGISTPYRRAGLLHQKHRDHFGQNDPHVLVVSGPTKLFNPTIDTGVIDRAVASDPEAARAEWDAEFRDDIAAFLDDALIDAAVDPSRPLELAPRPGVDYRCFVDASGGRHDAYTICIAHREGDRFIADVIRGKRPPFDPKTVTQEYAALVKQYHVAKVRGDSYAAEWVATAWRECNVTYERSELVKSALYLEALPLFTRSVVSIPNHPQLIKELRLLERRVHRSGKDVVDHGRNGHDDHSNALAGALHFAANKSKYRYVSDLSWVGGPDPEQRPVVQHLGNFILTRGLYR